MKTNLHDYYAGCAAGIEQVYQSADRQAELQKINSCFPLLLTSLQRNIWQIESGDRRSWIGYDIHNCKRFK